MNIFTINNNTGSRKSQACSPASRSSVGKNWMLRLFSLLLVLCMSCGAAWAQVTSFVVNKLIYENGEYKVEVNVKAGISCRLGVLIDGESSPLPGCDQGGLTNNSVRGYTCTATLPFVGDESITIVALRRHVSGIWGADDSEAKRFKLTFSKSDFAKFKYDFGYDATSANPYTLTATSTIDAATYDWHGTPAGNTTKTAIVTPSEGMIDLYLSFEKDGKTYSAKESLTGDHFAKIVLDNYVYDETVSNRYSVQGTSTIEGTNYVWTGASAGASSITATYASASGDKTIVLSMKKDDNTYNAKATVAESEFVKMSFNNYVSDATGSDPVYSVKATSSIDGESYAWTGASANSTSKTATYSSASANKSIELSLQNGGKTYVSRSAVKEADYLKLNLDDYIHSNEYREGTDIRIDTCTVRVTSSLESDDNQYTWSYNQYSYTHVMKSGKWTNVVTPPTSPTVVTNANKQMTFSYPEANITVGLQIQKDGKEYETRLKTSQEDFVRLNPDNFLRYYASGIDATASTGTVEVEAVNGTKVSSVSGYKWGFITHVTKDNITTTTEAQHPSTTNEAKYEFASLGEEYYFMTLAVKDAQGKAYTAKYGLKQGDFLTIDKPGAAKFIYERISDTNHFSVLLSARNQKQFADATYTWSNADGTWSHGPSADAGTDKSASTDVELPLYLDKQDITVECHTVDGRYYSATRYNIVALWSKYTKYGGSSDISDGQHLGYIAKWSEITADTATLGKQFYLKNDIDLDGAWWDFKSTYFKGQLDGNDYTVDNLHIDINAENSYYGIFPRMTGTASVADKGFHMADGIASVKNLNIANADVRYSLPSITPGKGVYVGLLAGTLAANAEASYCNVQGSTLKVETGAECKIGGHQPLYIGGLIGYCNQPTRLIKNCKVQFDVDLSNLKYEASYDATPALYTGSQFEVGGIFGHLYRPQVMPKEMLYSGKIAAKNAYVGPIFGSSWNGSYAGTNASPGYAGEYFDDYVASKSADDVRDAVATWFFKDYYVYVDNSTKTNANYNKEGVTPEYIGNYVKCTNDFPAKTYAGKTYLFGGYRSLLYSSTGAQGDITQMPYLQGVNLGTCLDADVDDFPFILRDGETYKRSKPFTVPSFSYVRKFDNTNWSSVFIPAELEYDDWKDKVDIAKFWDVNVYLPNADATKPELGVNTEIQVLILAKGDRIKPNVPYLIRAKEEILGDSVWFTHVDYKNGVKVEDADHLNILSCSDVETNFTFYGHYNEETDPQSLSTKWYALTHEGWWCAASKTAKLSPERVFVTIEGKNATKFYPELYKDGEPLFRDEMKAPTLRINVLNESEEMGETAIEQIAQNYGNEGDEVTRIPSSVIGLKAGNYVIGGKQIVVE